MCPICKRSTKTKQRCDTEKILKSRIDQGSLTEVEGSVQFTSLYLLAYISCFLYGKYYLLFFYKTSYLNEEANCTDPSLSVRIPWMDKHLELSS
jgi:hypothetical protein